METMYMLGLLPSSIDIVYPVKRGNANEELRYSLRSVEKNVPHRKIWTIGYNCGWTQNIGHITYHQGQNVRLNTTQAMKLACFDPDISDPFLYWNDDYFCMKQIPRVRRMNRGPIDAVITELAPKKDGYAQGMVATKNLLLERGYGPDILSYELHMPIHVYKGEMIDSIDLYESSKLPNLHKRTLYGNMVGLAGMSIPDNKIVFEQTPWDRDCTWISTSDKSFKEFQVGAWIKSHFPNPSKYEIT
jgi:hypothetical protein